MDLIEFEDFRSTPDDERCALMNRLRLDIHDPEVSAGRIASGLFGDKGQWIGFVQKTQFAIGILLRRRI